MMKRILGRYGNPHGHWVGDGFPVRSLFSYNSLGAHISPFLLLDYGGPYHFEPTTQRRGVGQHPHRGFETVTIVYEGEVEHRDSAGNGGIIGPGDVQWMTAAGGIIHEEYHSPAFAKTGGPFRVVQLWVNLPAKDKMAPAAYQSILSADIPVVELSGGAGKARIIAGELGRAKGPARTFTPINVWDVALTRDADVTFERVGRTSGGSRADSYPLWQSPPGSGLQAGRVPPILRKPKCELRTVGGRRASYIEVEAAVPDLVTLQYQVQAKEGRALAMTATVKQENVARLRQEMDDIATSLHIKDSE